MLYQKSKAKDIISDRETIYKIVSETMKNMSTVVSSTLGPGGRCVLIERDGQSALATKDGVTVARSLGVNKAEANIIIESAKEICLNTAKEAGDGTTTAIILANALIEFGHEFLINNPKYNPQKIVNELKQIYKEVVCPFLERNSIINLSDEELINVARISANGDDEIANVAVEAVMKAGEDGTVLIEESQDVITRVDTIDGYIVTTGLKDLGQLGPIFINDKANQQVLMDNGVAFLYDGSINSLDVLGNLQDALEGTKAYGKPLLIFAHDFSDTVMERIAKTSKAGFVIAPIKTPRSGVPNSRSMFLADMAAYLNSKVFDPGNISEISASDLGSFVSVKYNMYEACVTTNCSLESIEKRVDELKSIAAACHSEFDKMFFKAAIGKLTGGVSTIMVGGSSDLEIREKKGRVEDAVEAVRSAIAEGIIPGGCITQLKLASVIQKLENYPISRLILSHALERPFHILLNNCGETVDDIWPQLKDQIIDSNGIPHTIFNADSHKIENAFECGVIEPAKVCRVSIQNALSVASLLMTLGGIIVVPRDNNLENQLALSKQAFTDMMQVANGE